MHARTQRERLLNAALRLPLVLLAALAVGVSVFQVGCDFVVNDGDDDDSASGFDLCVETWAIPPDAGFVVVSVGAEPGGDGTPDAPLETLQQGIDASRANGARFVVLAPGSYAGAPWTLGAGDDDLSIVGCGLETDLLALGEPGIQITGGVNGVQVRDLEIVGAAGAVDIREGSGADAPTQLTDVFVSDSIGWGVGVWDPGTRAVLTDVSIVSVEADGGGQFGYGLVAWQADSVRMESGGTAGATTAGICADAVTLELAGTVVGATDTLDGGLGRGIHMQNGAAGTLTDVVVTSNSDAGIFLHRTGAVTITGGSSTDTSAVPVPGDPDGALSGAGLVVTSDILEDPGAPVEAIPISISGMTFGENERLGVVVEGYGVVVNADGLVFSDNILPDEETFPVTDTLFRQFGADVTVTNGEPDIELTGDLTQTFFRAELSIPSAD